MSEMYYCSTRGDKKTVTSAEAIVRGIAVDGGLFVPSFVPQIAKLEKFVEMDYQTLAYEIMKLFLTDFTEDELRRCIKSAYNQDFDAPEIVPVVRKAGVWFLELFHGPTLAFKDMALSVLPYLLKTAAKKLSVNKEIVILTATSGDTGKAALEGFANVEGTKIIVFFPEHGVSEIQKRQMVTQTGENAYVIGIEGNFDDAQNGVKEMFADEALKTAMNSKNMIFSSANSINIGRLIPQIVYYFYAYARLCAEKEICCGEPVNFAVPTGNFGNILAGWYAEKMGLPVGKLICASNENKVLFDFFQTGIYNKNRDFVVTMSPSMDILISSNLERLLYNISGEDGLLTRELMEQLQKTGKYDISGHMKAGLHNFYGGYASEAETVETIREMYATTRYVLDPHTAVSFAVFLKYLAETKDTTKTVVVSTASPYKFPSDVMKAICERYAHLDDFQLTHEMSKLTGKEIPNRIKDLAEKPILHKTVCQKHEMQSQVEKILKTRGQA